jgi:hypothetical protein
MDRIESDGVAAGLAGDEIFARQLDKLLNANGMFSLASFRLDRFQQRDQKKSFHVLLPMCH